MSSKRSGFRQKNGGVGEDLIVGRPAEIALLAEVLEKARQGHGQFVAVSGEPGIGKTRLASAASSLGETKGFAVFSVRCHEGQYVPPYWPWTQILRGVLELARKSPDGPACEVFARSLSTILPDAPQPGISDSSEESPEAVRLRVLGGTAGLIRAASTGKPILMILDNLHCADGPSLRLLEFVTREMAQWKVAIVAAHRVTTAADTGPFWDTIAGLAAEPLFTGVRLRGWDRAAIHEYLRIFMSAEPPAELVAVVQERTEGNPLFVSEVARLLDQEGLLGAGAHPQERTWAVHIPEKVRLAILGRVRRLTASCQGILAGAALAGREFDASLVQALAGQDAGQLDESLQEALGEGLIEEVGGRSSLFHFSHVLIQEAAAELLPAVRRAALHLKIGEVLERRFGADTEAHAGDLARHFEAAGPQAVERAIRYRQLAGERALRACGCEDGCEQFSRALALGEGGLPPEQKAELLFRFAQCQHMMGMFRQSVDNHRRAFDLYVEQGNIERALGVITQPYILSEQGMGMLPFLERALSLVGKDSPQAKRLGSHYGLCLYQETGDFEAAARIFRGALLDARERGDRGQEIMTLHNFARVLHDDLQFEKSRETLELGLRLGRDVEPFSQDTASPSQVLVNLGLGRLSDAADAARNLLLMAEKAPGRPRLAVALYGCSVVNRLSGDLEAALAFSDRALSLGPAIYSTWSLAIRAIMEYERGNTAEGAGCLQRVLDAAESADMPYQWDGWVTLLIPYIAWVSGERVPLERAEADARLVASSPGMRRGDAANLSAGLGLIAIMKGDAAAARKHYAELEPLSGLVICPYYGMTADHLLGLLAQAEGDRPLACTHFEAALDFCRSSGLRLEMAYTCRDYASLVAEGGSAAQRERARACRHEALATAQGAGLEPLVHRLKKLRQALVGSGTEVGVEVSPAGDTGALRGPPLEGSLTRREVEVILLLADGLSNDQIGNRLFISPHTVANHVQRILGKTGASNRTDAAMYAVRHGLTRPAKDPE